MMNIQWLFYGWIALLTLWGCAAQKSPTGGPKDETPPQLIAITPPNATLNFTAQEIQFKFNENLTGGSLAKEVFISPPLKKEPEVYVQGKILVVRLTDTLRTNTTYVLTLGTGIKDLNEKNAITEPIQYAFSTGSVLDTLTLNGVVVDGYHAQAEKGFTVFLYPQDTVLQYGTSPIYAAITDTLGRFTFRNIRAGTYSIMGCKDTDRSFSYNKVTEKVAIAPTMQVSVQPNDSLRTIKLTAFMVDTIPPKLSEIQFETHQSLVLQFNEELRAAKATYNSTTLPSTIYPFQNKSLRVFLPQPIQIGAKDSVLIQVSDTLGNSRDTLVRYSVLVDTLKTKLKIEKRTSPYNPFVVQFYPNMPIDSLAFAQGLALLDTGKVKQAIQIQPLGWGAQVTIPITIDTTISYRFVADSLYFKSINGFTLDTTWAESFKPIDPTNLATLSGLNECTAWLVYLIHTESKTQWIVPQGKFRLEYLPAGNYQLYLLQDTDGNGRWSAGRVFPPQFPELDFRPTETVRLRAGWEQEGFTIPCPVGN